MQPSTSGSRCVEVIPLGSLPFCLTQRRPAEFVAAERCDKLARVEVEWLAVQEPLISKAQNFSERLHDDLAGRTRSQMYRASHDDSLIDPRGMYVVDAHLNRVHFPF